MSKENPGEPGEKAPYSSRLAIRSINSLSGLSFIVPDYQRGYRWQPTQATQMLDDILEFISKERGKGEFYCLQPVVARLRDDGVYELVDGQQRLTTLYIILKFLEEQRKSNYPSFKLFDISYQTRPNSRDFLENIGSPNVNAEEHVDFYFMRQAYDAIKDWFSKINDTKRRKMLEALLDGVDEGETDNCHNVRIIWNEVRESQSQSIDRFRRLNDGKIALTDSELIKAFIFKLDNFQDSSPELTQKRIATEWEDMEQKFQHDSFWYFINNSQRKKEYANRIEFLFDIYYRSDNSDEAYGVFNQLKKDAEDSCIGMDFFWKKFKDCFSSLAEWYDDRALYHYIGFLIANNIRLGDLLLEYRKNSKSEFQVIIDKRISDIMNNCDLEDLNSADNSFTRANSAIRKCLLLFNILTLLESDKSEMRFPFDLYKKQSWDVEHICASADNENPLPRLEHKKAWAEDMLKYFQSTTLEVPQAYIKELEGIKAVEKESDIDREKFGRFYGKITKEYGGQEIANRDAIYNLTLLDSSTNRGYGNAIFPIKRMYIIDNDKSGIFSPIVTRNVFLKFYSKNAGNMQQWTEDDGDAYFKAMKEKLQKYLKDDGNGEQ